MRRKLIYVFLAVLVVGLLVGCDEDPVIGPRLSVSPTVLNFGLEEETLSFTIENTGTGDLDWNANVDEDWVDLDRTSGSNDAVVNVTVDRDGLAPPVQQAIVSVTSDGGNIDVGIVVQIEAEPEEPVEELPRLSVSPTVLNFGEEETEKTFAISNTGDEGLEWELDFAADWMEVDVTTGTDDAVVTVTVDRANLDEGLYDAVINITSNGGEAEVGASMFIQGESFSVSPTSLNFGLTHTALTFEIENRRQQDLDWTVEVVGAEEWVSFAPATGTNDSEVVVMVDRAEVEAGEHYCYLKVSSEAGNVYLSIFMEVEAYLYLPDQVENVYVRGVTAPEGTIYYNLDSMALAQMPMRAMDQGAPVFTIHDTPETMYLPSGFEAGYTFSWDPVADILGYRIYEVYITGYYGDGYYSVQYQLHTELPIEEMEDPAVPTYVFVDEDAWIFDQGVFAVAAYNEFGECQLPTSIHIEESVRTFWDWGIIVAPVELSSPAHGTTAPASPIFLWQDGQESYYDFGWSGYNLKLLSGGSLLWEEVLLFDEFMCQYPGALDAGPYQWFNLAFGPYCGTNPYEVGGPLAYSISTTWDFHVE